MRWAAALAVLGCAPAVKGPVAIGPHPGLTPPRLFGRSELVVRCSPSDAVLAVDGVEVGTCRDFDGTTTGLPLRPGPKRLEVSKEGFTPWQSWVEADGTSVIVNVTLSSKGGSAP